MKDKLFIIFFVILYVYISSAAIAIPFFNYKYAKEHGFTEWLFFGQIMPTLQSFIWPYYAFSGKSKVVIEKEEKEDMQKCFNILTVNSGLGDADTVVQFLMTDLLAIDLRKERSDSQRDFLKHGLANYIKFESLFRKDLINYYAILKKDSAANFKISDSTVLLCATLKKNYFMDNFDSLNSKAAAQNFKTLFYAQDSSGIIDRLAQIENRKVIRYGEIYARLFGEPLR